MLVGISEAILFVINQIFLCYNLNFYSLSLYILNIQIGIYKLTLNFKDKVYSKNKKIEHKNPGISSFASHGGRKFSYSTYAHLNEKHNTDIIFNQWLAGLIDGSGCFKVTKKGYASLEIVLKMTDKHCLYQIKQKFGGSVKLRSGLKWLRYRIHHKKGLLELIHSVNGEIRNPVRLLQLNKICENYNITLLQPSVLTYNNGWLSGFFDGIGNVDLIKNLIDSTTSLIISISHTNQYLLKDLTDLYGGYIEISNKIFTWKVNIKTHGKTEFTQLLAYFKLCPVRSSKHVQLKKIKQYLELKTLKAHKATPNSILGKSWINFNNKFNSRTYSTHSVPLNPWYITGLVDAPYNRLFLNLN
jgi:hypothetical protein